MRSLEITAPWHEEEEDVEVEDMELKHNGDDMSESSSDEATGRKLARRKNGGRNIFRTSYFFQISLERVDKRV